ncbi:MAG: hypothetical protein WCC03_16815 [Candidatus Acidiferrales bacterium]
MTLALRRNRFCRVLVCFAAATGFVVPAFASPKAIDVTVENATCHVEATPAAEGGRAAASPSNLNHAHRVTGDESDTASGAMVQILQVADSAIAAAGEKGTDCQKAAANIAFQAVFDAYSGGILGGFLKAIKSALTNILNLGENGLEEYLKDKLKEAKEAAKDAFKEWLKEQLKGKPPEVFTQETSKAGCDVKIVSTWDIAGGTYEVVITGDCHCNPIATGGLRSAQLKTFKVVVSGTVSIDLDYNEKIPILHVDPNPKVTIEADCDSCSQKKTTKQPEPPSTTPPPGTPAGGGGTTNQPPAVPELPKECNLKPPCPECMPIYNQIMAACKRAKELISELRDLAGQWGGLQNRMAYAQQELDQLKAKSAPESEIAAKTAEVTELQQEAKNLVLTALNDGIEFQKLQATLADLAKQLEECQKPPCGPKKKVEQPPTGTTPPPNKPSTPETPPSGGGGVSPPQGPPVPPTPPQPPPPPNLPPHESRPIVPRKPLPSCWPQGTDAKTACKAWLDIAQQNQLAEDMAVKALADAQSDLNQAGRLDKLAQQWADHADKLDSVSKDYADLSKSDAAKAAVAPNKESAAQWLQFSQDADAQSKSLAAQAGQERAQAASIRAEAKALRDRVAADKADEAAKKAAAETSWADYTACLKLPACPQPGQAVTAPPPTETATPTGGKTTTGTTPTVPAVPNPTPSAPSASNVRGGNPPTGPSSQLPSVPSTGQGQLKCNFIGPFPTLIPVGGSAGSIGEILANCIGSNPTLTNPNFVFNFNTNVIQPGQIQLFTGGIPNQPIVSGTLLNPNMVKFDINSLLVGPTSTDLSFGISGIAVNPGSAEAPAGPEGIRFSVTGSPGIFVTPNFFTVPNPILASPPSGAGSDLSGGPQGETATTASGEIVQKLDPNTLLVYGQKIHLSAIYGWKVLPGGVVNVYGINDDGGSANWYNLNISSNTNGNVVIQKEVSGYDNNSPTQSSTTTINGPRTDTISPSGDRSIRIQGTNGSLTIHVWDPQMAQQLSHNSSGSVFTVTEMTNQPNGSSTGETNTVVVPETPFTSLNQQVQETIDDYSRRNPTAATPNSAPGIAPATVSGEEKGPTIPPSGGVSVNVPSAQPTGSLNAFSPFGIPAGFNPSTGIFNVTGANTYAPNSPVLKVTIKVKGQDMAVDGTAITITISKSLPEAPGSEAVSRSASTRLPRTSFDDTGLGGRSSLQLASFHATDSAISLLSGALVRAVPGARRDNEFAADADMRVPAFNLVANGKSSGDAFEFQVIDPTGKLREIRVPDGLILEPIGRDAVKPVTAEPGQKMSSRKLSAFCVDFAKEPPEQNGLFRVAAPEIQENYKPVRAVIRAGRELAEAGKFHPDSEPKAYADSIRQYALWTKLEGWNQQQFADHFVERTKKNAEALHVKWTPQMESALRNVVPGRWNDIMQVLQRVDEISQAADSNTTGVH